MNTHTSTVHGARIIKGVTPTAIEKLPSGRLLVRYSTGDSEEFDTVLCAVGRYADTDALGLDTLGVAKARSGKLACTNEQTNIPHVYAIGDVVEGAPELTPVAILAGKLLARRLFGGSSECMNYKSVATTIFTPLEMGTVGLSEEEAIASYGEAAIDCYVSSFTPLEWSIAGKSGDLTCYAKIVVNKLENNKVLGLHIACPNAGEIIQGFALALKKGITHKVTMCIEARSCFL